MLFSKSERKRRCASSIGKFKQRGRRVDEVRNFVVGCIRNITTMLGIIVHKAGNLQKNWLFGVELNKYPEFCRGYFIKH